MICACIGCTSLLHVCMHKYVSGSAPCTTVMCVYIMNCIWSTSIGVDAILFILLHILKNQQSRHASSVFTDRLALLYASWGTDHLFMACIWHNGIRQGIAIHHIIRSIDSLYYLCKTVVVTHEGINSIQPAACCVCVFVCATNNIHN